MSWYELLLFLHIAAAVIWIGGGLMMQFFGLWRYQVALSQLPSGPPATAD